MGKRFGSLTCETESYKLFHKSSQKCSCATHTRSTEYIPEVTEHPHDYNMSTENEILGPKTSASADINDPTAYPGPHGKIFTYKRNLTLYLAQTKLPKAVCDSVRELRQ
jgi:hypothetical protein